MRQIVVDPPRHECQPAGERLSAIVHMADKAHEVYFRVAEGPIARGIDPFLPISLLPAMFFRAPLRITEGVSPRMVGNIPEIQSRYLESDPSLSYCDAKVPLADPRAFDTNRGVGLFFSGGVDSFHMLYTRFEEITHLIFVHGFDIRLKDQALYRLVLGRIQEAADTLGKRLILVETNLRDFGEDYVYWNDHLHGPALGAVALLLAPQLKRVYTAAQIDWPDELGHSRKGTLPDVDPLWSSEAVELAHEGHEFTRPQKLREIRDQPVAQRTLRVCWQNPDGRYNCCQCSKCVRTMVMLRAFGVLDRFPSFDRPLDLDLVRQIHLPKAMFTVRKALEETLRIAEVRGTDRALVSALRDCLEQRCYHGLRAMARRMAAAESCRRKLAELESRLCRAEHERDELWANHLALSRRCRELAQERDGYWAELRALLRNRLFRAGRKLGLFRTSGHMVGGIVPEEQKHSRGP